MLAGPIYDWAAHLDRARAMGFDRVLINPIWQVGRSGNLYAIRDDNALHPICQGDSDSDADGLIAGLVAAARRRGIAVLFDLVGDRTARDSVVAEAHPEWIARSADGSPRLPPDVDGTDPRRIAEWADLAALDWQRGDLHPAMVAHFDRHIARLQRLGVAGFRCDAARRVPAEAWAELVRAARARDAGCLFIADTLGAPPEAVEELGPAGFDYVLNSARWWDFRARWLPDELARLARIAPSVAFPESHATERVAAAAPSDEPAAIERLLRRQAALAATVSAGWLVPMGFEYGFRRPLDPIRSRPADWHHEAADPVVDLTAEIARLNDLKSRLPALAGEGERRLVSPPDASVAALLRRAPGDGTPAILLFNRDLHGSQPTATADLLKVTGASCSGFRPALDGRDPAPLDLGQALVLEPGQAMVLEPLPAPPTAHERTPDVQRFREDRVVIERVAPEIDGGRHPAKRTLGDIIEVAADVFADGHDKIGAALLLRPPGRRGWQRVPMRFVENDRWAATAPLTQIGLWRYSVEAWRDPWQSWVAEIVKKRDADRPIAVELIEGRHLLAHAAEGADALAPWLERASAAGDDSEALLPVLLDPELSAVMAEVGPREDVSRYPATLELVVDRPLAGCGAWYEMLPRSQSGDATRHGTFEDVVRRLPDVRDMGFDVLYFPPIHPIGRTNRKGRNNALTAQPGDVGSPYAIGAAEGGHDALHPELGTLEDFRRLVAAAREHGLEIAIDFAIQCSPDHPWLREHPDWFEWRPDGSIKYAENPPKKYEDIVNVRFYGPAFPGAWLAWRDVIRFWIAQGVTIFRVDNPHTKPLPFWEWLIRTIQADHPEAIFLSEAFTRPKMMKRLAKVGFTQSYTYFTWRNHKAELTEYLTELTRTEMAEYYRPNFFTNTPDINPPILQANSPAAYKMRLVLAATLSSVYGIYNGFELCEGTPIPGREEYLNSEKYEIRAWEWDRPGNIRDYIARINRIRRDNPALQQTNNLAFYNIYDDHLLLYGKMTALKDNFVLVIANLDPNAAHGAAFELPLWELGLPDHAGIDVVDLLSGERFHLVGKMQHILLDPAHQPCAIWRLVPPGA